MDFNNDNTKDESKVENGGQPANSSGDTPTTGEQKDDVTPVVKAADQTLDERTSVQDINNKTRELNITEKDGTKISAQINAPSLSQSIDIDNKRSIMIPSDDGSVAAFRLTTKDFDEALFGIFGVNSVKVNDKPAGEPISWEFFDKHDRETFDWMVGQADSFLSNLS